MFGLSSATMRVNALACESWAMPRLVDKGQWNVASYMMFPAPGQVTRAGTNHEAETDDDAAGFHMSDSAGLRRWLGQASSV